MTKIKNPRTVFNSKTVRGESYKNPWFHPNSQCDTHITHSTPQITAGDRRKLLPDTRHSDRNSETGSIFISRSLSPHGFSLGTSEIFTVSRQSLYAKYCTN